MGVSALDSNTGSSSGFSSSAPARERWLASRYADRSPTAAAHQASGHRTSAGSEQALHTRNRTQYRVGLLLACAMHRQGHANCSDRSAAPFGLEPALRARNHPVKALAAKSTRAHRARARRRPSSAAPGANYRSCAWAHPPRDRQVVQIDPASTRTVPFRASANTSSSTPRGPRGGRAASQSRREPYR